MTQELTELKQKEELTEDELKGLSISNETGLDHMMSLWNAVGKRVHEELPKDFLFKDYLAVQLNAGAQLIVQMFMQIRETLIHASGKPEALNSLIEGFQILMAAGLKDALEEKRKNMNW